MKCCQKMEEIESWNPVSENIYFWAHTLTNFYSKSWNGKNKVQTTSKMIFTDLNSLFDKKLYALLCKYVVPMSRIMYKSIVDYFFKKWLCSTNKKFPGITIQFILVYLFILDNKLREHIQMFELWIINELFAEILL